MVVSLFACARAPLDRATDSELVERFETLHRSVYDVFALGADSGRLRDHLAQSFAGDELTDELLEHYTTLALMARERTAVDVLRVDYEEVAVRRLAGAIEVDADWTVGGVVTHQGHRHPRINRYRATYRLASVGAVGAEGSLEALRIVDTRLEGLERIRGLTDLTGERGGERPTSGAGTLSLGDLLRSGAVELPAPGDSEVAEPPR